MFRSNKVFLTVKYLSLFLINVKLLPAEKYRLNRINKRIKIMSSLFSFMEKKINTADSIGK